MPHASGPAEGVSGALPSGAQHRIPLGNGDRSWIRLTGTGGRTAAAWMDRSMSCWQVCTVDLPGDPLHRTGLAAEPMTWPTPSAPATD